jgi:hypothetical protein
MDRRLGFPHARRRSPIARGQVRAAPQRDSAADTVAGQILWPQLQVGNRTTTGLIQGQFAGPSLLARCGSTNGVNLADVDYYHLGPMGGLFDKLPKLNAKAYYDKHKNGNVPTA